MPTSDLQLAKFPTQQAVKVAQDLRASRIPESAWHVDQSGSLIQRWWKEKNIGGIIYTDSVVNPSINYPKYDPKWVQ